MKNVGWWGGLAFLVCSLVSCLSLSPGQDRWVRFQIDATKAPVLKNYYGVRFGENSPEGGHLKIISSFEQSLREDSGYLVFSATVQRMSIFRKGSPTALLTSAEAAFLARYYPIHTLGFNRGYLDANYNLDNVVDDIVRYLLETSGSDRSLGDELDDADREALRISMIHGAYELYLLRAGLWNGKYFELGKTYEGQRRQFFLSLNRDVPVKTSLTITPATIPELYVIKYESQSLDPQTPVTSSLVTFLYRTMGPWNSTYTERDVAEQQEGPLRVEIQISSPMPVPK